MAISRRAALGSLAVASLAPAQTGKASKPNFLFLLADDHAGYVLGAAGNRLAETPNLDQLASQGTHFRSHFCNSPVCTPSRQSFLTGQMPSMAGVTVLRTPLSEEKPTIAKQLKQSGYNTAVFGKMHFNRPSRGGMHGFDHMMCEDAVQRAWSAIAPTRPVESSIKTKPQWRPFRDSASVWLNAEKLPFPRYEQDMKGAFIARQAGQYLEESKDKQFALWVSFQEPHSPFDFPIEDTTHWDPKRFPAPKIGAEDAWQIPLIFRDLSEQQRQGIIASYYTSARFLDRNVGTVLRKLGSLGLDENTVVVYMADHGYSLGHHGRFEKHCGYDPALHVPLIMRWPGHIRQGKVEDMTEHIDVAPTILDLLGAQPMRMMHAQSLRPYLEGRRVSSPRDHIFSQYLENEEAFVRTNRWKYILCSGRRERTDGYKIDNPTPGRYRRLYDLKADPGEFTDVAARNPQVVADMETKMLTRFRQTHPEAAAEPNNLSREAAIEWYLRPRDA
ncbi:MAG: sulfatase-like hydrolase/transferase [Acidobacteriia bacterium]|nr:sulfatase-like hydrolase/transferase [Terriglobia bacterium]